MRSAKQFLFGTLGAALALSGFAVLTAGTAQAASTGMIINEVYGGGGSTSASASYKSDFIELLNPTGAAQPLTGLSLQYRATGYAAGGTVSILPLPDENVPAGSKYLVQVSNPNNCSGNPCGGADVPSPDYSGTALNMAGSNGQVMLVQGTSAITAVGASMHTAAGVVDFVGYGTASSSETAPAGGLSTTTSIQRKNTTDGDDNATDFNAPATPSPEGMGAIAQPLAATNPGNKTFTQNQAIAPITLQATGGTSPYEWAVTTGTLPDGLTLAGNQISGTPTAVTPSPVEITVTATDSATPTPATASATFTIAVQAPLSITPIAVLQGTAARSPFAPPSGNGQGTEVKATEGVVTAVYYTGGINGMYIQTPGVDTADASDGIFVYGGSTNANIPPGLQVGDSVGVTGRIAEFNSLTQIVPGAGGVTVLGASLGTVTPRSFDYPATDAAREKFESELVEPQGEFTISNVYGTNDTGEIGLASGGGPLKQPSEYADATDPVALKVIKDQNAARDVVLDDGSTTRYLQNQANKALPVPWLTGADNNVVASPPRVGAGVDFHQSVVFDFRDNGTFNAVPTWRFQPTSQVTTNGTAVATFEDTRIVNLHPQDVLGPDGDVKIATFNVLNYFNTTGEAYADAGPLQNPPLDTFCTYYTDRGIPNVSNSSKRIGNNSCGVRLLDDPDTPDVNESTRNDGRGPRGAATDESLARQEAKLAKTIVDMDADVIGLEEIENSIKLPGESNRDDAVSRLVELLNAIDSDTWKYVKSPGESTTAAAVAEQDTIRPAFIYKPAAVTPVGQSDILFGTDEFANAREPLAQAFKKAGSLDSDAFAVIVNHFKSKGDNQSPAPPATGDNANSEDTGAFNGDRKRQATRLVQFADDFADERGIEAVFLAGDFNAYSEEEPVGIIEAADYLQVESDQDEESYSHSGLSGSLDHVFANAAARDLVTGADIWEINANEAISFQYSRYNYNVTDLWQPNLPFATSDHNPEIVGLNLPDSTEPAYDEVQIIGTNDFHGRLLPDGGNAAGAAPLASAVKELREENPTGTAFVAAGDLVGASTFESFIQDDEPTIDALNAMGLDVSAAGNHEFDRGYDDLANRIQGLADWEYIASNLDYSGTAVPANEQLAKTWVTELNGKRVGFVGAVTEDLLALVNPDNMSGVTVSDVVDATNAAAAALRSDDNPGGKVDLVVLLVHEGAPTTSCSAGDDDATTWGNIVQNTSEDVDAIISGHTHLAYSCKYTVDEWVTEGRDVQKRPVVSAGQYGTNLNKLVFKFDQATGDLAVVTQDIIATAGVGYAPDPAVKTIVDNAVIYANAQGSQVLGTMDGEFKRASYKSTSNTDLENRGGESTLSNQVAEAQRWATDADIAFMNPGGLRADMLGTANAGNRDLTYRQAADVQPFANTLVKVELTGAQLKKVLEQQWQRTATNGVPSRPFLRLGVSKGFTYTYVESPETVTAPNSAPVNTFKGTVTGMWLDGTPINLGATYTVTANSFLGGGGDNFWELANGSNRVDTGKVDLQAMVDYMAQYDAADPLPVDYSQRAVELKFPANAPASYGPGDPLEFTVGSWAMTASGDTQDTALEVKFGDDVIGTATVDNTIGKKPYDSYGTASVSLTLPNQLPDGTAELTIYGPTTKTSVPLVIATEDGETEIQIIGTNDFHGRILNEPTSAAAGAAILSAAVKELRQANPNTVFAAAGDLIGATTFESFVSNDKPTIDALNEAGLEVSAVGNHELDQGYEDLIDRVMAEYDPTDNPEGGAQWQYIASNLKVRATGDPAVPASWVKTMDGVDVGFVGAVTEALPTLVSPDGIAAIQVDPIVASVNAEAERLVDDAGVELVVMLVHEGAPSTSCDTMDDSGPWADIINNISPDVDAIVSGHTHLAYNCSFPVQEWVNADRPVKERPVVSAGQYGEKLNKLVFTVDRATGDVQTQTQAIINLKTCSNSTSCTPYTPDPDVVPIVQNAIDVATPIGNQVLGPIAGPFNRAKLANGTTENRGGESTLGNLVAEVQRAETPAEQGGAQIAFMNPGGLRAEMEGTLTGGVRNLTYRQAANVQPFANGLVNMDLTGAQIEKILEQQWSRTADGTQIPSGLTRYFLRLGVSKGFTYTYREVPAPGVPVQGGAPPVDTYVGDVTGMWLNGEPIVATQTYSVTVNAFLAGGGDSFWEFKNGTGKAEWGVSDLQAMTHYMATHTGSTALPVDYSQRAVEVHNVDSSYTVGGRLTFDVESWSLSNASDLKDTEIQVSIGDTVLGTATLDNTVGAVAIDKTGTATVDVPITGAVPTGQVQVTLTGLTTGTEIPVDVTLAKGTFVNDAEPSISGAPTVGSLLTADPGTWTPTPGSVTHQWYADGAEIEGATAATFRLTAAELDKVITVKVTAKATGYDDATIESDPTAQVGEGTIVSDAKPGISGTLTVGSELTATAGTWTPTPDSVSYQWLADGVEIDQATAATYTLTQGELNKVITVEVTAEATGYADKTVESDPTPAVGKPGLVTVTPPTVIGPAGVGQTLTVSPGAWQPAPDSVTYQWLANGVPISGATGPSLSVTPDLVGATITVAVTAHRAGYADTTVVFTMSTPVAKASSSVTVKVKPKKVKVGKKIKVVVTVTTTAGVAVSGPVTVKIAGQKAKTATVVNGTATVKLKKVKSPGKKKLVVTYQGSNAVSGSSSTTKVKVRR